MAQIKEFKISVPDSAIAQLKSKLNDARLPNELDSAGWSQGSPLDDVVRIASHWKDKYDWRTAESALNNELPQFTTDIDVEGFGSLNIHFVHKRSKVENAIPLIFVHGWPGSFIEVRKILPQLIDGGKDAPSFHVVAPSLPGYGFSEGATKKGFGPRQCAETCHKLMLALGYTSYATQGGDWGYIITRCMGLFYPTSVAASHLNMVVCQPPTFASQPLEALRYKLTPYSAADKAGLARRAWFNREGNAYYKEQATKPQTISYALTDSPVALLAWIYEKLHDWTDAYPWTEEEVCTWISIYWFSRAGPGAAGRLYYEAQHDTNSVRERAAGYIPHVKYGLAIFPKELFVPPKTWRRTIGNVVLESEWDQGGHFAAWERPDAIVQDLRTMFGKNGGAYQVVKGASGYASTGGARL